MSRPRGACISADWGAAQQSGMVDSWCTLRSAVASLTDTSVLCERGTTRKEFHMSITREVKEQIIAEYATHEGDTGSPEVQVAVLSHRISNLTEHLKDHPHDHHTRRGLMALVGRRRRMLQYLYSEDIERYRSLIERLGLRK